MKGFLRASADRRTSESMDCGRQMKLEVHKVSCPNHLSILYIRARKELEHGLLRPLRLEVTSKVILRSPWPQEATRMAITVNMHMDIRVKDVNRIKI